jgi:hypothetical protein
MKRLLLFAVVLACACATNASAGDGTVDWSQLGPAFTLLTTPENWVASNGYTGEVGITGSPLGTQNMERVDEGNGWGGNFSLGEALIWNEGGYQQTDIDIGIENTGQLTYGGGAAIQADFYGPFTATLTSYDSEGDILNVTTMTGDSNGNEDGSAIFIGWRSPSDDVWFQDFNVVDQYGGDSLAIGTYETYGSVPEPSSLMLLGSGLLGLGAFMRRKISR